MTWGRMSVGGDFLLVIALALYLDNQGVVPLALLACAIHEGGHLLALRCLKGELVRFHLSCVGAEMQVAGTMGYEGECLLALSGPLVNIITAVGLSHWGLCPLFCGLNLALALLNMLPVGMLDGGRALQAVMAMVWGGSQSEEIYGKIQSIVGLGLLGGGVVLLTLGGSFTLLLLAVWILWTGKNKKSVKKILAKNREIE